MPDSSILFLPYKILNEQGKKWLVLISGFPDDENSFDQVCEKLPDCKCLCLSMPGFSQRIKQEIPRFGFTFDEIISALDQTIKIVIGTETKFDLLAHDWGSAIAFMYLQKKPKNIEKFITLDIGLYTPKSLTWKELVVDIGYKGTLALAFLWRAFGLPTIGILCFALFPWKFLGPCPHEPSVPPSVAQFFKRPNLDMCYPYFQLFKGILTSTLKLPTPSSFPLPPCLFIYGKRKRIFFHSAAFLRSLQAANNGSKVIAFDCGHFIQSQCPTETANEVRTFLLSSSSS
uniref:AB hydrolase-1 domain-containing protein n=1 Tax=Aureoumbra lagunensis TaxID=44058 RepID=A0A6S8CRA2_9STRA|mmetsp:Transcript_12400/g.16715  ORF Transcript_12400/g.16715 Transcript_12400/m.16715 type:complete len:287 (-) Transcript_12400:161-1021(-)